jgi:hypothetical protein
MNIIVDVMQGLSFYWIKKKFYSTNRLIVFGSLTSVVVNGGFVCIVVLFFVFDAVELVLNC